MYQPKIQLEQVRLRITAAAEACDRLPDSVRLLAASKRQSASKILQLHDAGLLDFGENYVSEAISKQSELREAAPLIRWHFIGPVQSNKTRAIAESFHWVQSVDRRKIIDRLDDQRPSGLGPLNILLQVNIDDEAQKSGASPEDIEPLAAAVEQAARLTLRGIMAIPRPLPKNADDFSSYESLERLYMKLQSAYPSVDTLSVGMSGDLEVAINHGSTMVRIGSALMGHRD